MTLNLTYEKLIPLFNASIQGWRERRGGCDDIPLCLGLYNYGRGRTTGTIFLHNLAEVRVIKRSNYPRRARTNVGKSQLEEGEIAAKRGVEERQRILVKVGEKEFAQKVMGKQIKEIGFK